MKLEEVIKAYNSGKCEAFGRNDYNVVCINKGDFIVFKSNPDKITNIPSSWICDDNWELINEVKQFEEVEITQYALVLNSTKEIFKIKDEEPEPWILSTGTSCVKLTGILKREIKPKVKRKAEIELSKNSEWHIKGKDDAMPIDGFNFFVEWEE